MESLADNFSSIQWWISVVLVGVLINIASHLIIAPWVSRRAATAKRLKAQTRKAEQNHALLVTQLRGNLAEQAVAAGVMASHRSQVMSYLLTALSFSGLSAWVLVTCIMGSSGVLALDVTCWIFAVLSVCVAHLASTASQRAHNRAGRIGAALTEARDGVDDALEV